MNHKLHNTILASAIVGAVLMFGLLSARPLPGHAEARNASHSSAPASQATLDGRRDRGLDLVQARFQPDLAGSPGQALATASVLLAGSVVEATVASVLDDLARAPDQAPARGSHDAGDAADEGEARHARRRAALATPYFSTARGSGRAYAE